MATKSTFTPQDIQNFEFALRLEPLTVQDLHAIFNKAGMRKVNNVFYTKKQKDYLYQEIYRNYMLKDELRNYVMNYKQEKGEKIQDTENIYENKQVKKLSKSRLRKIIKESLNKVLKENASISIIQAIMQSCNVGETEAQEYLDNAAREIHSWMDQGVDPSRQTGYGGNYYEEQMEGLGLDDDYLMDFAQYCLTTYKPQEKDENTPMSEEETISVLEEHEDDLLSPFRLYVDRQTSVIQLYYSAINKADKALQYDIIKKYKQIKKELPEWCPVIVNEPRIEENPNGTQDFIVNIEYDENEAQNFVA